MRCGCSELKQSRVGGRASLAEEKDESPWLKHPPPTQNKPSVRLYKNRRSCFVVSDKNARKYAG